MYLPLRWRANGEASDPTLVSLDDYSGLIWKDRDTKQIAVKGGTRVREVMELLANAFTRRLFGERRV